MTNSTPNVQDAENAVIARDVLVEMIAVARARGLSDDEIRENFLRAAHEVNRQTLGQAGSTFTEPADRSAPQSDMSMYNEMVSQWRPPVHDDDLCNRRDCTVHVELTPDGRPYRNAGVHNTYVATQAIEWGDVARVSVAAPEGMADASGEQDVYVGLVISAQDAEVEHADEWRDTYLTPDEADALARALSSRAAELRRVRDARREVAADSEPESA